MLELLLVTLVVAAVLAVVAFAMVSLQRVCVGVLADSARRDERALEAVNELSRLHADSVRAALDATTKAVESIASALRPVYTPAPDMPDLPSVADLMASFELPDDLADWTDLSIPRDDERELVAIIPPGYNPGAELGLS